MYQTFVKDSPFMGIVLFMIHQLGTLCWKVAIFHESGGEFDDNIFAY